MLEQKLGTRFYINFGEIEVEWHREFAHAKAFSKHVGEIDNWPLLFFVKICLHSSRFEPILRNSKLDHWKLVPSLRNKEEAKISSFIFSFHRKKRRRKKSRRRFNKEKGLIISLYSSLDFSKITSLKKNLLPPKKKYLSYAAFENSSMALVQLISLL